MQQQQAAARRPDSTDLACHAQMQVGLGVLLHVWPFRYSTCTVAELLNFRGRTLKNRHESQSLSYGELWVGVTYTVPRRATINAPPPMGPLGGLMGDPGASFRKYPRRGTIPKGGFDTQP